MPTTQQREYNYETDAAFSLRKHGTFPSLEHLPQFYLSQAVISFAAMFFWPALVFGITSALQKGSRELLSFIVLFGAINSMGALAGQALFGNIYPQRRGCFARWGPCPSERLALGSGVGFHNSGLSGCAPRNSYPPQAGGNSTGETNAHHRCIPLRCDCQRQAANRNTLASSGRAVSGSRGLDCHSGVRGNTAYGSGMAADALGNIHGMDVYAYHLSISS